MGTTISVRGRDRASSLQNGSDEYFHYICDPCSCAGDYVEAQGYCTKCEDYLCRICFKGHSRSKLSCNHALLDQNTMPRKLCDPCKTAGDDVEAKGYCRDCRENLCTDCFRSHSRNKLSNQHLLLDKDYMSKTLFREIVNYTSHSRVRKGNKMELEKYKQYMYFRDIIVKTEGDNQDCYISGMAVVTNTELVITDECNKSLKLVDVENNIVKSILKFQSVPSKLTAISNEHVAVVFTQERVIEVISLPGVLNIVQTLRTDGDCIDVECVNVKLYVSFRKPVKFQILLLTGEVIKTILPSSEVLNHCISPSHIAVSPDERLIYVSDWRNNKVMSVDMNGKIDSVCPGGLLDPFDVIISKVGLVYLLNRGNHKVYKMASDFSDIMVILRRSDGVVYPMAMGIDSSKQYLYISSGSAEVKHRNVIKVFKWE